ncbi:TetR/AcrR family transcriptional regulator [Streptomyces sp. NPDC005799]|uniref:TetR/AcrR family transcriptional regulator n=1 Tax=Streptomyces sp. NPDC005799 TaxID=3154678 RepID=UPI0034114CEB
MSTTPAVGTRPLRADAERNRQRLIAAARELYATRGLDISLDEVARHAGVGIGTAYRRFADRGELVEAVLDGAEQRILECAEEALAYDDAWEAFEQFFLDATTDFAANRGLRQLLLEGAPGAEEVLERARNRIAPVVGALITRAQQAGQLRTDFQPMDFSMIQLMLGAVTEHNRDVAPDLWRRYVTLFLDGLRAHRTSPTPLPAPALADDQPDQREVDASTPWMPQIGRRGNRS